MFLIGVVAVVIGVFVFDIVTGGTLDELQGLVTKKDRK